MNLAQLTTLGVGGQCQYQEFSLAADFTQALSQADVEGREVLILGGGSNILGRDQAAELLVLRPLNCDYDFHRQPPADFLAQADKKNRANNPQCDDYLYLRAGAGVNFEKIVEASLDAGCAALAPLSGIPGTIGAAPVQNIGAYGLEIGSFLLGVQAWDRLKHRVVFFNPSQLQLQYRSSILKTSRFNPWQPAQTSPINPAVEPGPRQYLEQNPPADQSAQPGPRPSGRWAILEVFLALPFTRRAPVNFAQLAGGLGVDLGTLLPGDTLRQAVLALRGSKGMLLSDEQGARSAGSFFMNPIVDSKLIPAGAPRYPVPSACGSQDAALEKTSAAWLIEHAGFSRGYRIGASKVSLARKHVLALTTQAGASRAEVDELRGQISKKVQDRFQILLEPEPVLL